MSRHLRPLSIETLGDLPEACQACTFWEAGTALRGPADGGVEAKRAWVEATTSEWGSPGRIVYVDGSRVAFGVLVPPRLAGQVSRLNHVPSEDALLLATMAVDPRWRAGGLGRVLLQALLRDAHERGAQAVEAYGQRGITSRGPCILSERFLRANGFALLHDDLRLPLLRLDLRATVRWHESISARLEQVGRALRQRSLAPAPARPVQAMDSPRS